MSRLFTSRNVAVAKYICFLVAGILFTIDPITTVKSETNTVNMILWHVFMIVGAMIGLYGAIRKRYLVEGLSFPLLASGLAVYVVILSTRGTVVTVGLGLIVFTAILGLVGRAITLYELSSIERDMQGRS